MGYLVYYQTGTAVLNIVFFRFNDLLSTVENKLIAHDATRLARLPFNAICDL